MARRLGTSALAAALAALAGACSTDFEPIAYWAALDATPPSAGDAVVRDIGMRADAGPGADAVSSPDAVDLDAGTLDAASPDALPGEDALPGQDALADAQPSPDATTPRDTGPDAGFLDATTDGGALSRLIVTLAGPGLGAVRSLPPGIDCGGDCQEAYLSGTMVDLTATPGTGSAFVSWGGACSGTGTCRVTMSGERNVVATFDFLLFPLNVSVDGDGTGIVTSTPGGITCGSDCMEQYAYGTMVTLRASATTGSSFGGWSGACTGTGDCVVTIDAAKRVNANFARQRFPLRVNVAGAGSVRSSPAGITCPADCEETYVYGTAVTLEATGSAGNGFTGWSGACMGMGGCTVLMTAAREVTASFGAEQRALTVNRTGMGSGRVVSAPSGIDCGADCMESYALGTMVQLIALPDMGSTFGGWSNACSGTGACAVTMSANRTVGASFVPSRYVLTVTRSGQGMGTVVSTPAGIDCGADCTQELTAGTMLTLEARPGPGARFVGWTGGCTGTGTCALTISGDTLVGAIFEAPLYTVTVRRAGGGAGTVRSSVPGIDCGAVCTAVYAAGTMLVLTPTPAAGSGFAGWGGDCGGAAACTILVDADRTITAVFDAGLVAYYPFQGTAQDASRNGHDGAVTGAMLGPDRANTANNAYSFDGSDYIDVANAADLSGFASFSLCLWANPVRNNTTRNNVMTLVSKEFYGDSETDTDSYSMRLVNPQRFEPEINAWTSGGGGGSGTARQGQSLQGSVWSHLCTVYDGMTLELYVNGNLSQTDTLSGAIHTTTAPLRLGKCNGDQRCDGRTFSGRLDEVKLWSRALSPAEINAELTR